jgi:alanyl-tRNA synthetase
MQQTERLYFTDSSILDFSATVIGVTTTESGEAVVLDRTAFYPTGGGQPNDTGRLGDTEVIDVVEDETGTIFHLVREKGRFSPSQLVQGTIDARRRLDHLQQHSGQHILSQAFVGACGAETRSFHLGALTSTIDVEIGSPTDDHMRAAEDIANRVIFEDRAMRVHIVSEQEAARLPLRKETAIQGELRVIEVEDFDWSPCGGTHAARTGQVGLVAIKSYERVRKITRVEFVCGLRALDDYRRANSAAYAVARLFSAERDAAPELVARALQENKSLKKRQRELLDLAMTAEAAEMLSGVEAQRGFKLVTAIFDGRDAEELRVLAAKLAGAEPVVALLATKDSAAARLVFARSPSLSQNMGQLLAEACQAVGGRGGGRPELAQGGGTDVRNLDEAIKQAARKISDGT